jgi:hypothetical protein
VRRLTFIVAAIVAALAVGPATAVSERNALVRPARGIGKISLGMTQADVRRALGRPIYVRRIPRGFGRTLIEMSYWLDGWTVRLAVRNRVYRVVYVETTLARERTRRGLGVGSTEPQIRRTYPRLTCRSVPGYNTECVVGSRRERHTVFGFNGSPESDYRGGSGDRPSVNAPRHVDWVAVREPS